MHFLFVSAFVSVYLFIVNNAIVFSSTKRWYDVIEVCSLLKVSPAGCSSKTTPPPTTTTITTTTITTSYSQQQRYQRSSEINSWLYLSSRPISFTAGKAQVPVAQRVGANLPAGTRLDRSAAN